MLSCLVENAPPTARTSFCDVYALAPVGSTVHAGGEFKSIGAQARRYVAALDGTGAATPWNPSPDGPVYALSASETSMHERLLVLAAAGAARDAGREQEGRRGAPERSGHGDTLSQFPPFRPSAGH
jgi:hypothetical protein